MKVVVVSQRVDLFPERNETRDALDQRLAMFLAMAGFLPVAVPNVLHTAKFSKRDDNHFLSKWLEALQPSAVMLSGGNDIGKCKTRDFTEDQLLDYAERRKMPVLGICRGMQMMAHWSGAELHRVKGHVQTVHQVSGKITGKVNSYHDFSIKFCPSGYELLARSEDGEIEAIRHQSLPWEGWMWHPERNANFEDRDLKRIKVLFGG